MMRYFISKSCLRVKLCLLHAFVNNDILLKLSDLNRNRRKCGCDAVKVEFLKKLRKMENNNEIFSDILEQSAITVMIIHLNTMKHCAAVDLRYSNHLNRTELGLDVSLTLFLKTAEIPLVSNRLVLMFLILKSILGGSGIHTFCNFCPYIYVTSSFKD